jgi:hypothetical protein
LFWTGSSLLAGVGYYGIYRSTDFGESWTSTDGNTENDFTRIGSIIYTTSSHSILSSSDDGVTWRSEAFKSSNSSLRSFAGNDRNFFATTYNDNPDTIGVFLSNEIDSIWTLVSEGLPKFVGITTLCLLNDTLFAGTSGTGVWRRPLSEIIGTSAVHDEHTLYSTIEAFPNPTSTRTQIHFTTTEHDRTEIVIVNALGETVEHLFDGPMDPGEHSIEWNTSKRENGVYFAIVKTPSGVQRVALSVQH